MTKPTQAADYPRDATELARQTILYIATKLGDLAEEIVIVGGLVPGLLVSQDALPPGNSRHIGTMDVDLGLAITLLDNQRYAELADRLRNAGFSRDENAGGQETSQRWRIEAAGRQVTVDFLIPPALPNDRGGTLRHLENGFAAIITPGLELAFRDQRQVTLTGQTLFQEQAMREVYVCEAGAYVVLKALAFSNRGENKDAYDLIYILKNYGSAIGDVAERLKPLLEHELAQQAIAVLGSDFKTADDVGVRRYADFLGDADHENEAVRADAAGLVRALLDCLK